VQLHIVDAPLGGGPKPTIIVVVMDSGLAASRRPGMTSLVIKKLPRALSEADIADVIDRMAKGHSINRIDELLPWNWRRSRVKLRA
jgi:hypothetical protein